MRNNTPILEVRDLLKTFGAVVAAKDINVDISKGEVVGIIGANGAGKTCFVNMVTGYLAPTEGSIKFEGKELIAPSPLDFVFNNDNFFSDPGADPL